MENYFKLGNYLPANAALEFRKLKNNIFLLLKNKHSVKSILIASSIHKEGSSVVAKNLSQVIAEDPGLKVLLMDLNFRSNSIYYGKKRPEGLSDFFLQGAELESIIKKTDIENLHLLSPGNLELDPPRIIELKEFSELVDRLKNEYSYIIIDAPPLQYYPEATLLSSKVDGVILVVQAEEVRRQIVKDTKKKLDNVQANLLGVIFNRKKFYIPRLIYSRL